MKKKSGKIVHIFLALILLYFGQGFLFGEGLLARLILVMVVGISFYYWLYAITKYKLPLPLRLLSFLLIIWTFYGIPPILFGSKAIVSVGRETFYYLKSIYISILPIFTFYVLSKQQLLTEGILKKWFFIFIILALGDYYYGIQLGLQKLADLGINATETTNNSGYTIASILCLIPLLYKRPILQYFIMVVCLLLTIASVKRGAIICAVLCSVAIIWMSLKSNTEMKKENRGKLKLNRTVKVLTFAALLIIVGYYAVESLLSSSDYFSYRFEETLEGNTSSRDTLYLTFLNYYLYKSEFLAFFFGNGAYGTIELLNSFAHNDWLEIAIDNGLFVLILYACYWISMLSTIKGGNSSIYTIMLTAFVIIYLFRSFLSMSYSDISPFASCAMGFSLANFQDKKRL